MIQEMRAQLIEDLETGSNGGATPVGVTVYDVYPGKVNVPCAIVGYELGQYIVGGQTFPSYEVRLTVTVVVPRSVTYVTDLETLVERVIANTQDFGMRGVDVPSAFTLSAQECAGTVIHLAKNTKL